MNGECRAGRRERGQAFGFGIDDARPGVRVSTTDCATSGSVKFLASAAAAAAKPEHPASP